MWHKMRACNIRQHLDGRNQFYAWQPAIPGPRESVDTPQPGLQRVEVAALTTQVLIASRSVCKLFKKKSDKVIAYGDNLHSASML